MYDSPSAYHCCQQWSFRKKVHIRCASQPQEFFFVLFSVAILGGHHEEANTKTRHEGIGKVVVSNMFYFHHYLGKWSNLTNIFQLGWNHHLGSYLVTVQYNSMFFAPLERCKAWAIYDGKPWCVIWKRSFTWEIHKKGTWLLRVYKGGLYHRIKYMGFIDTPPKKGPHQTTSISWKSYPGLPLPWSCLPVGKPGVMALLRWAGGRPMNMSPLQV